MYDLLVLSFNQCKPEKFNTSNIFVKPLNKHGEKTQKYYHEIWPFINNAYGVLYKIYTVDGLGEFECCDELFEFGSTEDNTEDSIIVENDDCKDCISICIQKPQYDIFVSILEEIISCSPISTIAFLCRGQSLDKEVILGTICIKDFCSMLLSGKVKTNICYIIGN